MKKVFCLLFCILCFSSVLSAKLLTHLEFENSLEDSAGDNNGTFTRSDSSIYNTGRNGKALVFNGTSDYLEFGANNFDPSYAGRYSISMWVLSSEQASSSNNNTYIGKHIAVGGMLFLFGYFNGQLYFQIKNASVSINAGNEPAGYWVHYAISAKEENGTTSAVIYKNGSQVWSGTLNDVMEIYESLGKMINSVIFVFRPVIDGIPIFAESIEVEYDAEGFYQLRSNVPYSVSETKRSMIKSEDDIEAEIYSALGKEEEKILAYVLNEENEFILSAVAKDDANETYLTISLEADHD